MTHYFGIKEDNKDYRSRRGVYGIFRDGETFGFVSVRDMHFLVGGGIEGNEDQVTALKREFREEIGYDIQVKACLGEFVEYHYASKINENLKLMNYIYEVELLNKVQIPSEDDHTLVWLKANDVIDTLVLECQKSVIKDYKEYTSK